VPMDAATRAGLIDLMARVLVAVFHEEGGTTEFGSMPRRIETCDFLSADRVRTRLPAGGKRTRTVGPALAGRSYGGVRTAAMGQAGGGGVGVS
jgi:hypothetical protein